MPLGDERRSRKESDGSVFFHFQFNKKCRLTCGLCYGETEKRGGITWLKAVQTKMDSVIWGRFFSKLTKDLLSGKSGYERCLFRILIKMLGKCFLSKSRQPGILGRIGLVARAFRFLTQPSAHSQQHRTGLSPHNAYFYPLKTDPCMSHSNASTKPYALKAPTQQTTQSFWKAAPRLAAKGKAYDQWSYSCSASLRAAAWM